MTLTSEAATLLPQEVEAVLVDDRPLPVCLPARLPTRAAALAADPPLLLTERT